MRGSQDGGFPRDAAVLRRRDRQVRLTPPPILPTMTRDARHALDRDPHSDRRRLQHHRHCHLGPGRTTPQAHDGPPSGPWVASCATGGPEADEEGVRTMTRRFSLLVDDRPETLLRVTGLCLRRRADVLALRYGRSRHAGWARLDLELVVD